MRCGTTCCAPWRASWPSVVTRWPRPNRALAERVRASFRARFIHPKRGSLADVVDGPEGDDWTVRPNQIFAVSLPDPLLEGEEAQAVVDTVGSVLLTSYGLRSLSPDHVAYHGADAGD